ncbi:MAG: DUF3179 domain-containing protein [Pseudomonadota bacterium]
MTRLLAIAALGIGLATASLANPSQWQAEWPRTDFGTTTVSNWSEIISGGPPKDGIPAISDPAFRPVAKETRLAPREPVITVDIAGATPRAYPIRYLTWHEIVNDAVGGRPIAVTYCPLCNSAMTFDRRVGGQTLSFGVSGKLRHSDMIMYDRETDSWWQQAIGQGIVGHHTGADLATLPTWMESWEDFRARHPNGLVMDEPRYNRAYGRNPYSGYDTSRWPFLYSGETPPHDIDPLARVVRVGQRAWPLERLRAAGEVREAGLVLTWRAGMASALDTQSISRGRDIGAIRTKTTAGRDVAHDVMFAFAFHAFHPDGTWMLAP